MAVTKTEMVTPKYPYMGYVVLTRDADNGLISYVGFYDTQEAAKAAITADTPDETLDYLILKCDIIAGIHAVVT